MRHLAYPYLLFVADSMWRGRDDMGLAGTGNNRQQWISYRDQVVYEDAVQASSLFPVPELKSGRCSREEA